MRAHLAVDREVGADGAGGGHRRPARPSLAAAPSGSRRSRSIWTSAGHLDEAEHQRLGHALADPLLVSREVDRGERQDEDAFAACVGERPRLRPRAASSTMRTQMAERASSLGHHVPILPCPREALETRQQTRPPRPGAHPPERDLGNQHHRDQPHEPRPEVEGQTRLAPVLEERVLRLGEDTAARQLRQLAQERLVDAQVPELLGIRYHQTGELGAHHLLGPPLGHADQVHAFLGRREAPAVAPGTDLLELDHGALLVRRDHADLRVEEVDELALADRWRRRAPRPSRRCATRWPPCRCACRVRSVQRVTCDQNLLKPPQRTQSTPHLALASEVNAAERPSP